MAVGAANWLVGASSCEGERPSATFTDLPSTHRREFVVGAVASAVSTVCFAVFGILLQPIPSRSLAAPAVIHVAAISQPVSVDARAIIQPDAPRPHPTRTHRVGPLASVPLVSASAAPTVTGMPVSAVSEPAPKRRNLLTRFVRSLMQKVQPLPTRNALP